MTWDPLVFQHIKSSKHIKTYQSLVFSSIPTYPNHWGTWGTQLALTSAKARCDSWQQAGSNRPGAQCHCGICSVLQDYTWKILWNQTKRINKNHFWSHFLIKQTNKQKIDKKMIKTCSNYVFDHYIYMSFACRADRRASMSRASQMEKFIQQKCSNLKSEKIMTLIQQKCWSENTKKKKKASLHFIDREKVVVSLNRWPVPCFSQSRPEAASIPVCWHQSRPPHLPIPVDRRSPGSLAHRLSHTTWPDSDLSGEFRVQNSQNIIWTPKKTWESALSYLFETHFKKQHLHWICPPVEGIPIAGRKLATRGGTTGDALSKSQATWEFRAEPVNFRNRRVFF